MADNNNSKQDALVDEGAAMVRNGVEKFMREIMEAQPDISGPPALFEAFLDKYVGFKYDGYVQKIGPTIAGIAFCKFKIAQEEGTVS